ncbi:holin [Streptomyces meridianus]|uniref:Holin n=1 Tax=Streptomyces meridianus TaxID=2938945 RepID=A0ABT0XD39_9ACTN|nr:holin [Streptomyces meridianus]MCM2580437.1 holin [Streptomyces meridianus]
MTKAFWKATAERAVRTFAQALLAVLGAGSAGLLEADWAGALSAAGMAAVLAAVTAVATSQGTEGPGVLETVRTDTSK